MDQSEYGSQIHDDNAGIHAQYILPYREVNIFRLSILWHYEFVIGCNVVVDVVLDVVTSNP